MAMPRSPRYSWAHLSKAKVCESRSRGPSAWQACMYSWPSVPSGVRLLRIANQTLELPAKYCGLSRAEAQVLLVELEQAQEIDEVRLHEAQAAQVRELFFAEPERVERRELRADRVEMGTQVDALGAAPEPVLDLRAGKVVQHDLHHGELVQVGVQQRLDDHACRIVTLGACAAVTRFIATLTWWRSSSTLPPPPKSRRATTSVRPMRS